MKSFCSSAPYLVMVTMVIVELLKTHCCREEIANIQLGCLNIKTVLEKVHPLQPDFLWRSRKKAIRFCLSLQQTHSIGKGEDIYAAWEKHSAQSCKRGNKHIF